MPYELRRAIRSGDLELVKSLIREGADVNQIDKHNHTPLTEAIQKNSLEMVKELLDNGAKINIGHPLFRALCWSAVLGVGKADEEVKNINYKIVELLIDRGGNVNDLDEDGVNSLVWYALGARHRRLVELLLKKGADIEQYDYLLKTAISLNHNNYENAKLIISFILLRYQPKEKPSVVKENKDLSDYWDAEENKINFLLTTNFFGKNGNTPNTLSLYLKNDSLRSLSFTKFFNEFNPEKIENENFCEAAKPIKASISKLN